MTEREHQIAGFLTSAGWGNAEQYMIAGDMSPRRYRRLIRGNDGAILMDAEEPQTKFVDIDHWLVSAGLRPPKIYAAEPENGLVLLEDFGDQSIKVSLESGAAEPKDMIDDCISVLLRIRHSTSPSLPHPNAAELTRWTLLADEFYPGVVPGALETIRARMEEQLTLALQKENSVSLRDFHTQNVHILSGNTAYRRLGLLDFQDAFLTHPAYDLMSLLTDARFEVTSELRSWAMERYLERSGDEPHDFSAAFAALSVQRNLRIMGIFTRGGMHLKHLPRTYRYFCDALDHPVFAEIKEVTLEALPPPERAF